MFWASVTYSSSTYCLLTIHLLLQSCRTSPSTASSRLTVNKILHILRVTLADSHTNTLLQLFTAAFLGTFGKHCTRETLLPTALLCYFSTPQPTVKMPVKWDAEKDKFVLNCLLLDPSITIGGAVIENICKSWRTSCLDDLPHCRY